MESRYLLRLSQRLKLPPGLRYSQPPRSQKRKSSITSPPQISASSQQAIPLGGYYASILEASTPTISNAPATSTFQSTPATETAEDGPSILFSSRLSSPLERRSEIERNSKKVAGVLVPTKPEEPDNCCMSGCVNCVWDRYRDELEEWAAATKKAEIALRGQTPQAADTSRADAQGGTGLMDGKAEKGAEHTSISMDDDGGGSEGNWRPEAVDNDELFKGLPVGIRAFIQHEKKLKEKHKTEGISV